MTTPEVEKRRRQLMRGYELITLNRQYRLGHESASFINKTFMKLKGLAEYQLLPHYFGAVPKWRMLVRRFSGKRTLPDFCIVGPIKSGSSDLAVNLLLHPCIMTPISKEFLRPNPQTWRIFYPTERAKNKHIQEYGAALSPFMAPYLHWMELIYRFSRVRPDAKIVLTLRDPSQRVYSHWKWDYFLAGRQTVAALPFLQDFETYVDRALEAFPAGPMYSACGRPVLHTSIYDRAVAFWIECFGRDQVLVLDVAGYWRDRSSFLNKVFNFLELEPYDVPASTVRTNANPLKLPRPADATIAKLRRFFEPYNSQLFDIIGEEFAW